MSQEQIHKYFVNQDWISDKIANNKELKILEAGYDEGVSYKEWHIPHAVYMNISEIESEAHHWNILPAKECKQAFLSKGITKDTALLVYANDLNAAARLAFVAFWLGVKEVKIFHAVKENWHGERETKVPEMNPVDDFGGDVPGQNDMLVQSSNELVALLKQNQNIVLASVRSWEEYIGKVSGYDFDDYAGEILGAVYAKASDTCQDINFLVDEKGVLRPFEEILEGWRQWGITEEQEVIFHCGIGWRAATAYFIAKESGWQNIRLFDGSWYDWFLHHQLEPAKYPIQLGYVGNQL